MTSPQFLAAIPAAISWVKAVLATLLLAFLIAAPARSAEDDRRFRTNIGLDYTSGSYGADEKTEIVYIPWSVQAEDGPWTVRAVVPWLHVSGPALILDGADGGAVGTRATESASGLGDISLSLMYSLEQLYDQGLFIDFTGRFKLPTASLTKGLGTGKSDASFQVDVAQSLGQFIPFATLGYKWAGVPEGFKLRNTIYGSVGLQYSWSETVATGLSYDYRQSSIKESSDPQEGLAYLNVRFTDEWSVNFYGIMGFSENSPDAGGGVTFVYRFP